MGNGTGPVPATVVDDGLGNTCYLLDLGDGGALVVDPPRDLRFVRAAAEKAGLRIRFVADTHLHADFLSGAVQLAKAPESMRRVFVISKHWRRIAAAESSKQTRSRISMPRSRGSRKSFAGSTHLDITPIKLARRANEGRSKCGSRVRT